MWPLTARVSWCFAVQTYECAAAGSAGALSIKTWWSGMCWGATGRPSCGWGLVAEDDRSDEGLVEVEALDDGDHLEHPSTGALPDVFGENPLEEVGPGHGVGAGRCGGSFSGWLRTRSG